MRDLAEENVVCPYECNKRIRKYYNWENVSSRTELVYQKVSQESLKTPKNQLQRLLSNTKIIFLVYFYVIFQLFIERSVALPLSRITRLFNTCLLRLCGV